MLYLIINESGKPEHRWAVNASELVGVNVVGPAIKKADGTPEDDANLQLVNGQVSVNATVKAQREAAAQAAANQAAVDLSDLAALKAKFEAGNATQADAIKAMKFVLRKL